MNLGQLIDGDSRPSSALEPGWGNGDPGSADDRDDYSLPVPLTSFQLELHNEIAAIYQADVAKYFEKDECSDPELANSLQAFYTTAQHLGTHPYLLVDHYLPPNMLLKEIPSRLANSSGKFAALVHLVELLRDRQLEVALIARPGKTLDLIEAVLLGKMINYKRHSGSYLRTTPRFNKDYSTVHLIPSSLLDSTYVGSDRFDLVVAFDQTFNADDAHIHLIRSQARTTPADQAGAAPKRAPIIRLVPYVHAEHLVLKLAAKSKKEDLVTNTVAAMVVMQSGMGTIPKELQSDYTDGLKVLKPWLADMRQPWPLSKLPNIEVVTPTKVRAVLVERGITAADITDVDKPPTEDTEDYRAKKIKLEDPVLGSGSFVMPALNGLRAQYEKQHLLAENILKKLEHLRNEADAKETSILQLRKEAAAQQEAYEEKVEEMRALVNQISELTAKVRLLDNKTERQEGEKTRLQEQVDKQLAELNTVNALLDAKKRQDGALPKEEAPAQSIATADAQTARIAELEKELAATQEQISVKTAENDLMRSEYQRESTVATESVDKVTTLKAQNDALNLKLASGITSLKPQQFEVERKLKEKHSAELTLKLSNVELYLRRILENEKHTAHPVRSRLKKRGGGSGSASAGAGASSSGAATSRKKKSPSGNGSRRSSPSDREGSGSGSAAGANNGPHPLQNMVNSS